MLIPLPGLGEPFPTDIGRRALSESLDVPRPGFHRLDPDVQRRVLDVATEAFASHGYDASYNGIIEASGLSKGSMYHHFSGKPDLFVTVLMEHLGPVMATMSADLPSDDVEAFWGGIRAAYEAFARASEANPQLVGLLRAAMAARTEPAIATVWEHELARTGQWLSVQLASGRRCGAVRDDVPEDLLLAALMGMGESMDQYLMAHWPGASPSEQQALLDQHLLLMRSLAGT